MNYALAAEIGKRIRELRLQHGWSQTELGRKIGVNKSVISFYELGTRFPTYENLLRICDVFNVTADYILRGDAIQKMSIDALPSDQIHALRTIIAALHSLTGDNNNDE